MSKRALPSLLAASIALATAVQAETADDDFFEYSLQELIALDIPDVTSVSRKQQRQMDSAAAIYVVTDEDIRRSGVTTIPDALRMVPGLQVAKLNANTWSVSSRGFNYVFANKLLVLIDGRTIYSPMFSGVNWDVQDTMLEDIDRIEVIRGPGAALWGSNAVNGVINIITKKAADTQGSLISAGGGSEEKAFGAYRYGGTFGSDRTEGFYRVYVKTFNRDGNANADGSDARDDWKMDRAGFKAEWKTDDDTSWSFQGDIYEGTTRPALMIFDENQPAKGVQTFTDQDRDQKGGNLIGNWKFAPSDTSDYSIRAVYDNYQNFDYRITEKRDTFEIEFQHYAKLWGSHDLVWGLSYRGTWYEVSDMRHITLYDKNKMDKHRFDQLYSAFIQDDITLTPDWTLTLSSRLEHNDYTGYEFQPNARIAWKATENRTFWAAVSRAVKTPSVSEHAVETKGITFYRVGTLPIPTMFSIKGNDDVKSEKLTAFELGYRELFADNLRIDITGFYNEYKDLIQYIGSNQCVFNNAIAFPYPDTANPPLTVTACTNNPLNPAYLDFPTTFNNNLEAKTYGLEFAADWQVNEWWKLQVNYSWLQVDAKRPKNGTIPQENENLIEDLSAHNVANLRSSMNLPNGWYFDAWVRYIDNLKNARVKANTALDLRIAKQINENIEVSLVGQNIFENRRQEFTESFTGIVPTQIEESWYAQIRWQF
ncbi:TonB-dependent receptor plug domain-containing protein [Spongorhabdus nitratireducens]